MTTDSVAFVVVVARFVRALLLCACVHAPLLWTPVRSDTGDKLDVWIDGKEVEQFVGEYGRGTRMTRKRWGSNGREKH